MNKFRLLFLFLSISCPCQLLAQNNSKIDSLEDWVSKHSKKDSIFIKNLIELERQFYIHEPSKSGTYIAQIIKISKDQNFPYGLIMGHKSLAHKLVREGKYNEAISAVLTQIKYEKKLYKGEAQSQTAYSVLGYIYYSMGNYEESIKYCNRVITDYRKLPIERGKVNFKLIGGISNLTMAYNKIGKYEESLKLLLEGYNALNKIADKEKSSDYYYLRTALLLNLSDTYGNVLKYDIANKYLQESLDIIKNKKIAIGLARFYLSSVKNNVGLKKFNEANKTLLLLAQMKEKSELESEEISIYYKLLEQTQEGLKKHEEAYLTLKAATALNDSLKGVEQKKEIDKLMIEFESKNKDAEIVQLNKEKELNETRSKLYLISLAASFLLLTIAAITVYYIQKAKLKVEQANALRDKLFAIVSHDLRSPSASLRQITSKIDFVLKKNDPKATQLLAYSIENTANSLYQLVDNLLHWTLLKQNKVVYTPESFVVQFEIDEVLKSLYYRINDKQITVTTDFGEEMINGLSDRLFVQTIVRNLLDNAIKHTPQKGKIDVELTANSQQVNVKVSDNGKGVPEYILKSLFSEQLTQKRTDEISSKGVGLYLCYQLARLSGGNIFIESTSPAGTIIVYQILRV